MLYTLGLRLNEALNLTLRDVNFDHGTIFIQDSKFHKDRIIPFGPKMGVHLKKYIFLRRHIFKPVKSNDYLFIARQRFRVSDGNIRCAFSKLIKSQQTNDSHGKAHPRLHDLRHTFAVHRLLQWYKDGVDVQNKLPLLSTFMGHVDIYSTQVYLSITEDILKEANKRFQLNFGSKFDKEILS
ncbi:MAG: Integrase/recombinase [Candidatus Uhrbacteria bacterium GW2011_GWF2_39_13]|uniref:Integrase/recombinase n=1 Tax=Candidatus Uhrbacteria bacterium GW2011_GWF2_39_13 TaxID=1618995 RepID=A0A0G0MGL8_9BACT|nr:MAG: Integrase/recombinase [Candidatus Uhrbacteria bacterium GW2011_GWF2_39_13]